MAESIDPSLRPRRAFCQAAVVMPVFTRVLRLSARFILQLLGWFKETSPWCPNSLCQSVHLLIEPPPSEPYLD